MPRHRLFGRHGDDDEAEDWAQRRGRFADCDEDTADRPQVRPGRRPDDPMSETHNLGDDGIREREAADELDGPWRESDEDRREREAATDGA